MRKEGQKLRKYKYLRREDRKRLAEMYERGDSISEIATAMEVHPNTVYNEIKRGRIAWSRDGICAECERKEKKQCLNG